MIVLPVRSSVTSGGVDICPAANWSMLGGILDLMIVRSTGRFDEPLATSSAILISQPEVLAVSELVASPFLKQ